jgi:hypothetical protein
MLFSSKKFNNVHRDIIYHLRLTFLLILGYILLVKTRHILDLTLIQKNL